MSNNGEVEFDGDCWFFALRDSDKIRQVEADARVELAYIATERGAWVSLEGTAYVVTDDARKRELWMDDLRTWFPGGPEDPRSCCSRSRRSGCMPGAATARPSSSAAGASTRTRDGTVLARQPGQHVTDLRRRARATRRCA